MARVLARAATQHSLVTIDQCRALGLSPEAARRLVARGMWERAAPGVLRIQGSPRTWESRALAAVLAAGPDALASHLTAAHLWGLEGFGPPGRIDVTVRRHSRPRRRRGVVVHESLAFDLTSPSIRSGVPVTGPARTLIDVAGLAEDDLTALRALDEIRRRRLAEWPELWEAMLVHTARGRPGVARGRRVIALRYGKAVPHGEFARLFLLLLDAAGLPEPVSEHRVVLDGRRCRIDAAYPVQRVAIELDGGDHEAEARRESDERRDRALEGLGWTVIRFRWADLAERPDHVVAAVRRRLLTRRRAG
jgi:hypothetical protein